MLFCLIMTGCSDENYTKIGTSDFSIIIPEGYVQTEDEFDEDQIAYYHKDDQSIDFDVYQWDKEYTLEQEAEYFASQYDTTPVEVEINGIVGMKYISMEIYGEYEYTVVNYMFEDEDSIIELSFWTVGSEEEFAAVKEIIETIKKN